MLEANATVEWTPDFYGKRMDDWLRNMGDWNISRKRYCGLPLPFYPCECGHLNVVGSRAELRGARDSAGSTSSQELHRPVDRRGADPLRGVRRGGAARSPRSATSGSTPASSRSRRSAGRTRSGVAGGYATGAAGGSPAPTCPTTPTGRQWFPADWVSEMREQIRLWFYSQLFMSVALVGRAPYRRVLGYEKLHDETGREMHKSWGNAIDADEAFERMGADVMRWLYCATSRRARTSTSATARRTRSSAGCSRSGTRCSSSSTYANIEGFRPTCADLEAAPPGELRPLDRWLLARTQQLVAEATDAYERFWTPDVIRAFEAFVDDLSNWYIRRSRRRF